MKSNLADRLDTVAWGLFFIWVGIVWFGGLGWGTGLIGTGAIVLAEQVLRAVYKLPVEGFWVVAGVVTGFGGLARLLHRDFGVVPVLLVLLGIVLLAGALKKRG